MDQDIKSVFVIRVHHNMAYALSTQNVRITAFNFDKGYVVLTPENIDAGLRLLPRLVQNRSILDEIRDIFILYKTIKTVKPEIVHVNALQDLMSAFIAIRFCAISGLKPSIIAMSRNSLSWGNPRKAWLYAKFIQFFADGFIALSNSHKNRLLQLGVPSEKLTVIPNPYDPAYLQFTASSCDDSQDKTIRIIYVANICENKAQDVLITAASSVIEKYPQVRFDLVGRVMPGDEAFAEQLTVMVKKYGIEPYIHFAGEVPYEEVKTLLLQSHIFVFPTRAEMMPRAVIEAMMVGKPVVASAVDGILDIIQNGKTGILVQPGNSTELSKAICELIENPVLTRTLGSEGQKFVLDCCSPEKVGRQFCNFYQYIRTRK